MFLLSNLPHLYTRELSIEKNNLKNIFFVSIRQLLEGAYFKGELTIGVFQWPSKITPTIGGGGRLLLALYGKIVKSYIDKNNDR